MRGDIAGPINAISRHGLLPRRHLPARLARISTWPNGRDGPALLRTVRAEAAPCQAEGGDWRSVVDGISSRGADDLAVAGDGERRRFVRHLASHWDAHRHRVAPEIDDLLQSRLRDGRLSSSPAASSRRRSATTGRPDGPSAGVECRTETISVGLVINCTGPARDIRQGSLRLLARSSSRAGASRAAVARPGR